MNGFPGLVISFFAGLASFLSPCVFPLVPSYISVIGGGAIIQELDRRQRVTLVFRSIWFVIGFSLLFSLLGIIFNRVGSFIPTRWISLIAGSIVVIFGFNIIFDFLRLLNFERRFHIKNKTKGYAGAMIAGMAFGAGWSPCIGPILTTILFLAGQSSRTIEATALLIAYSIGLGLPFILAGIFLGAFQRIAPRIVRYIPAIRIASGIFLVLIGILMIFDRFRIINAGLISSGYTLARWSEQAPVVARIVPFVILLISSLLLATIVSIKLIKRIRLGEKLGALIFASAIVVALFIMSLLQLSGQVNIVGAVAGWLSFQGI